MAAIYMDGQFRPVTAEQSVNIVFEAKQERVNPFITRHLLTYHNRGEACDLIPVFEQFMPGKAEHYMIPCVNYNGNAWGDGQEPKGIVILSVLPGR